MEKHVVCWIASSFLYFSDLVDGGWHEEMMNAITGAERRMRNFPLELIIWCSCKTQRKRASMVPVKMIGVHLTCFPYVRAQKLGLSIFVKLTSNQRSNITGYFNHSYEIRFWIEFEWSDAWVFLDKFGFLSCRSDHISKTLGAAALPIPQLKNVRSPCCSWLALAL